MASWLESLTITGFKSYARSQTIHFDRGLCVLHGPNGCGKSNIVDALLWAFGEDVTKLRAARLDELRTSSNGADGDARCAVVARIRVVGGDGARAHEIAVELKTGRSERRLDGQPATVKDVRAWLKRQQLVSDEALYCIRQAAVASAVDARNVRPLIVQAAGCATYLSARTDAVGRLETESKKLHKINEDIAYLRGELARVEALRELVGRRTDCRELVGTLGQLVACTRARRQGAERARIESRRAAGSAEAESIDARLRALATELGASERELAALVTSHSEAAQALDDRREALEQLATTAESQACAITLASAEGARARRQLAEARTQNADAEELAAQHMAMVASLQRQQLALDELEAELEQRWLAIGACAEGACAARALAGEASSLSQQAKREKATREEARQGAARASAQHAHASQALADAHDQAARLRARLCKLRAQAQGPDARAPAGPHGSAGCTAASGGAPGEDATSETLATLERSHAELRARATVLEHTHSRALAALHPLDRAALAAAPGAAGAESGAAAAGAGVDASSVPGVPRLLTVLTMAESADAGWAGALDELLRPSYPVLLVSTSAHAQRLLVAANRRRGAAPVRIWPTDRLARFDAQALVRAQRAVLARARATSDAACPLDLLECAGEHAAALGMAVGRAALVRDGATAQRVLAAAASAAQARGDGGRPCVDECITRDGTRHRAHQVSGGYRAPAAHGSAVSLPLESKRAQRRAERELAQARAQLAASEAELARARQSHERREHVRSLEATLATADECVAASAARVAFESDKLVACRAAEAVAALQLEVASGSLEVLERASAAVAQGPANAMQSATARLRAACAQRREALGAQLERAERTDLSAHGQAELLRAHCEHLEWSIGQCDAAEAAEHARMREADAALHELHAKHREEREAAGAAAARLREARAARVSLEQERSEARARSHQLQAELRELRARAPADTAGDDDATDAPARDAPADGAPRAAAPSARELLDAVRASAAQPAAAGAVVARAEALLLGDDGGASDVRAPARARPITGDAGAADEGHEQRAPAAGGGGERWRALEAEIQTLADGCRAELRELDERAAHVDEPTVLAQAAGLDEARAELGRFDEKRLAIEHSIETLRTGISDVDRCSRNVVDATLDDVRRSLGAIYEELVPSKRATIVEEAAKPKAAAASAAAARDAPALQHELRVAVRPARPPGPEPDAFAWSSELRELSGGQRTLLSVALLVSCSLRNPASLLVMDELDAALDERNTEVVARLMARIAQRTQVLAISHRSEFQKLATKRIAIASGGAGTAPARA